MLHQNGIGFLHIYSIYISKKVFYNIVNIIIIFFFFKYYIFHGNENLIFIVSSWIKTVIFQKRKHRKLADIISYYFFGWSRLVGLLLMWISVQAFVLQSTSSFFRTQCSTHSCWFENQMLWLYNDVQWKFSSALQGSWLCHTHTHIHTHSVFVYLGSLGVFDFT